MTSLTSMHHPTYYQVMLEQGAQIDIVNQQPTRISTSSLSFVKYAEWLELSCIRKLSMVLADVVVSGSLFQSVVVLGKKENLYISLSVVG
jgi:hypothetical protein